MTADFREEAWSPTMDDDEIDASGAPHSGIPRFPAMTSPNNDMLAPSVRDVLEALLAASDMERTDIPDEEQYALLLKCQARAKAALSAPPAVGTDAREALAVIARTTFSGSEMGDEYQRGNRDAHQTCARIAKSALANIAPGAPAAGGEVEALESDIGILLSALRYHEEAVGETFDDEGGIIAQIEADHKARQPALIAAAIQPPHVPAGVREITDAMVEAGARAAAIRRGHKDCDALITTTNAGPVPVWKFYTEEPRAILEAALSQPGHALDAGQSDAGHLADMTLAHNVRETTIKECLDAMPSTAENPNEDTYQRGRVDGIVEYQRAILSLRARAAALPLSPSGELGIQSDTEQTSSGLRSPEHGGAGT